MSSKMRLPPLNSLRVFHAVVRHRSLREAAEELRHSGYTVIVDNKSGAAGRIAVQALLQAPADGTTLVMMPGGNVSLYSHVYTNLPYKMSDLAPIATLSTFSFGLGLGPGTPAKTLPDFVKWAKANPGKASYGTPGAGTGMHFMGVMLARDAGFDFQHVPYRGGAAAMTDLLGGTLPALATTLPNLVKMHKVGKLKIVAFTGDKRLTELPDVPTFKEQGYPDLVLSEFFVVFASAKTPAPVVKELEKAFMAAGNTPRMKEALKQLEFQPLVLDAAETRARIEADSKRWGPVVKASGYSIKD